MGRIIIGILMMIGGFLITWKADAVYRIIGQLPIGEKMFGGGGTRFLLKLIGIAFIFVGFFVITKFHERILEGIFGRLF